MPANYHLSVVATADPAVRTAALLPLTEPPRPTGTLTEGGRAYLLKDTGQESLLETRYRLAGFAISIAERAFSAGGVEYPAGSWILPEQRGLA